MSQANKITSTQNNRVKMAANLQKRPRLRRAERRIVLEGLRLMRDAHERGIIPDYVFYDPENADYELIAALQNTRAELLPATEEVLRYMSDTQQNSGMLGVYPLPSPPLPRSAARVLILDAVRDPGNMGTLLRTAAAAGADLAILAPDCVDPYNPKVLRAGMGAHFRIPVVEASWGEIAGFCLEIPAYVAAGDGELTYSDVDWTRPWAMVIGNEAHGSTSAGRLNPQRIAIPMESATESINAAAAAAVILFEAQRQRRNQP